MIKLTAADVKLALLVHGLRTYVAEIPIPNYKRDKYLHNDRHVVEASLKREVPQELLVSTDGKNWLCVGILTRPDSPWSLAWHGDSPLLLHNGSPVDAMVRLVPEPEVWKRTTSDGVPAYKLISIPGLNEINLWPWHDCALHYEGVGCAFCTTTTTASRFGTGRHSEVLTAWRLTVTEDERPLVDSLVTRSVEALSLALELDFKQSDYWFTIISGNLPEAQLDRQHALVATLVDSLIYRVPALRRDRVVANVMPPLTTSRITEVRGAGVTHYMANLELWDEQAFAQLCPGKHHYGRSRFLKMLTSAVEEFGRGQVWCNFVAGLEPFDVQLQGYEELARRGVACGANVFHDDAGVQARAVSDFNVANLRDYYRRAADILRANGLLPFYGLQSRRSSVLWEAFLGLFDPSE